MIRSCLQGHEDDDDGDDDDDDDDDDKGCEWFKRAR